MPICCEFPDGLPEDFLGVPLERHDEFRIDLILVAAPNAKLPYPLTLSDMQELSF